MQLNKQDLKPVSKSGRLGSWFIVIVAVLAGVAVIIFGLVAERDLRTLILLVPIVIMLHTFGSIALTGYAPWYLLFTHEAKIDKNT